MDTLNIAAVQMVSRTDPAANLADMRRLVRQAAAQGADWVLLPEYWPVMARRDADKPALAEPFGAGRLQDAMAEAAAECRIILFGGTIPLQSAKHGKISNSMLVYGRNGECLSRYDKMHLFRFQSGIERYDEGDTLLAGSTLPPPLEIDGWRAAQGICYDLRFPEFFRAQIPADILLLPAAFTHTTGQAHWELLLRARAVENQCYLAAAGQGGLHENGRRTFGHSMLIDPWGNVLARQPENEGIVMAAASRKTLDEMRTKLPALSHRTIK